MMRRAGALHLAPVLVCLLVLAGCGSTPSPRGGSAGPDAGLPSLPKAGSGRGGYYKDDGPGDNAPPGLYLTPDAQVRIEPYSKAASRPYEVFGQTYTPITHELPFSQRGVGSWYGKKFHGLPTASGEPYDMYKMTAAHPTLPIPSFVRLTSIVTGKQVIVRVNDRGPFHADRIIDVSYTAALKLGLLGSGSHELQLERLLASDIERILAQQQQPAVQAYAVAVDLAPPAVRPPAVIPASNALAIRPAVAGSFYLQLGAFARVDNAEAERSRLAPYADRLGTLEVVQAGALYRLYGGPFQHRLDAVQAGDALPVAMGIKSLVVQR
jgi:rare lipoprotein A